MWHIYTTKYYSEEIIMKILKFAGKWMELQKTILNEVTQSQKEKHGIYLLIYGFMT